MPVDAFAVSALAAELAAALDGCRIDKIYMPSRFEAHLAGRGPRGSYRLLLSAHPQRTRVHFTNAASENPPVPPMFCMLLRKHLTGGRFIRLVQPELERVLRFEWSAADEMGNISQKSLIVEMIGRHSNVILADAEGRVVDALRRVDTEMSPLRPVLPGLFYRDPPPQDKIGPLTVTEEDFYALWERKDPSVPNDVWLGNTFTALTPLLCRDIANSSDSCGGIYKRFVSIKDYVNQNAFTPYYIKERTDFFSLPLLTVPQERFEGTFSELLDKLYTNRDRAEQLAQKAASLTRTAKNNRDKTERKLGLLRQELFEAQNREPLREKADLLMANLHRAERGAESVTVEDFYHDNAPAVIRLDPAKSPQQNAAAYYKSYAKAKNAEAALSGQIVRAGRELEYWESVLEQLSRAADERDLEEIRDELRLPAAKSVHTKKKEKAVSQPARFRSSEGVLFRAGRNNRQNDLLTMRLAGRGDIWLHAQKIPGCHVVVDTGGNPPGERTLYEAASVAAWFSQARTSPKVPVDYTAVKYVKKPPAARPGMVIYDRFKTILAEPDEGLAERLRID